VCPKLCPASFREASCRSAGLTMW